MSPENVGTVTPGLNSSFSAGPDVLHPHLLKACSAALALPFFIFYLKGL